MAPLQLKTVFCVVAIFISTSSVNCLTGQTISLDQLQEQVQQLRANYIQLKETLEKKDVQFEAEVAKLKELVKMKDEQHKILADKLNRLEFAFRNEIKKAAGKSIMARTCKELHSVDPTLTSGMYWIDPDGQGVGDDPIHVNCDMTTGMTSVPHDSELPINVGHCADPGCYSKAINYNSSQRQMRALVEISAECHQSIKYECNYAPFEFNTVTYSWWNDRNGNAQYFWAGSNSSVHTCQCGIDGDCIDPTAKCNCDATLPIPQVDSGVITDSQILPVTRLNFGRTPLETSSGVHTLGRFECSGQVAVTGMPKSCEDLWRRGYTLSGLYSVMGTAFVESVYCDFSKLIKDPGFEKWIGYTDVKSAHTYFYVQRETDFIELNATIPFEIERLNIGNALNLATGIFTASRSGTYFFSFTGMGHFITSSATRVSVYVGLFMNGIQIGVGLVDEANTVSYQNSPLTIQSTLQLKAGDQIWLEITYASPGMYLHDGGAHYNHFTGWMLNEDISQSL